MKRKSLSLKSFTLIELLVVITIILILMGLLLPAISGIKEKAVKAKALNNARQIVTLMLMYADDDIDKQKMPIHEGGVNAGVKVEWGLPENQTEHIVTFLMQQGVMEDAAIFSGGSKGDGYVPRYIENDTAERWDDESEIDFNVYSTASLKSTGSSSTVIVATLDNPILENCQHAGKGWNLAFLDGSGKWVNRASYKLLAPDADTKGPKDDTLHDGTALVDATTPETAKNGGRGGGSSSIMGKKKNSKDYKWIVLGKPSN